MATAKKPAEPTTWDDVSPVLEQHEEEILFLRRMFQEYKQEPQLPECVAAAALLHARAIVDSWKWGTDEIATFAGSAAREEERQELDVNLLEVLTDYGERQHAPADVTGWPDVLEYFLRELQEVKKDREFALKRALAAEAKLDQYRGVPVPRRSAEPTQPVFHAAAFGFPAGG
jgi:hypothetical protein